MNYNKYKLSEKFNEKKNEYEKIIEQNTKEYFALNKKLNDLISGKEILDTNKEYEILNLKTKLLTLEVDINSNKRAIEELYIREMDSNLNKSRLNKEIDSTEFADQKRRLNSMKIFNGCKNDIKTLNLEDIIIDFKLRLEELKNSLKMTTVEQKNINIKELEREKEITRQCYESSQEKLINEKYDYDYKNIYYDRKVGKIDREEQQEKIKNLENKEKVEPTDEEVEKMVDDFSGKYLEKEEIVNEKDNKNAYEKEISKRNNFSVAEMWKENEKQNLDEIHETSAYTGAQYLNEKHYKILANARDKGVTEKGEFEYMKKELGKEYSRGIEGDKKELFEEFAKLEVDGRYTDNPKLLLEFEKVKGLDIEEIEDVIGLDVSDIKKDIYIATYEKPVIDEKTGKEIMEPIKEYYIKNEKGEYSIIGNGDKENTNITVDGIEFNVKNENIVKGDKLEEVTQKECAKNIIRNEVEDSFGDGRQVTRSIRNNRL
jgi:hypothetical protein